MNVKLIRMKTIKTCLRDLFLCVPQVSWRRGPVRSSLWTGTAASRGGPSPDRRLAAPAGRDRSPGRHEPDRPASTVRCSPSSYGCCQQDFHIKQQNTLFDPLEHTEKTKCFPIWRPFRSASFVFLNFLQINAER